MIKTKSAVKPANLFFIELLMVLLFFSFSSAVILNIFAMADHRQKISDLTEKAVICAQSVAEAFSVSGNLSETAGLVFGTEIDGGSAEISLDDNFKANASGVITAKLVQNDSVTKAGTFSTLELCLMSGETEIYTLNCSAYIPYEEGNSDE